MPSSNQTVAPPTGSEFRIGGELSQNSIASLSRDSSTVVQLIQRVHLRQSSPEKKTSRNDPLLSEFDMYSSADVWHAPDRHGMKAPHVHPVPSTAAVYQHRHSVKLHPRAWWAVTSSMPATLEIQNTTHTADYDYKHERSKKHVGHVTRAKKPWKKYRRDPSLPGWLQSTRASTTYGGRKDQLLRWIGKNTDLPSTTQGQE